ncbi:uncharacterized protein LOC130691389 [Daphnia carinata]|uniref:uncharacterized protein LOC130691389 n=1 Tax=Daphnia carinata TaxID=120202 RepID=UPI00257FAB85|nr:uncharacterized protein LOC130691389 [Daphnia carinata]
MGCVGSKDQQKAAYDRLSQYQLASLEESKGLKKVPIPLDPEEGRDKHHSISPCQFHNLFYDGFYAPYMSNPDYLMLVDVRDENSFLERHILSARWYGTLPLENLQDLSKYTLIILYDQDGSDENQDSNMKRVQTLLQSAQLDPFCICGGIVQIERSLPYMIASNCSGVPERQLALGWYPSIIMEDTMWLGRMEQGSNTTILLNLNITHLIHIGQTGPALAFPGMTCLTVNWSETLKGQELYNALKGATSFAIKAIQEKGRVLILGDQGVNRSATLTMAVLMQDKSCTLEDSFYYVKCLRPAVQPSPPHLEVLSKFETELFGKKISSVEDLW